MTATLASTLSHAKGQIGYNGTGSESNPSSKFGEWYGLNPAQWCAEFASWCLAAGGGALKIETAKGFAYCPSGVVWFKAQNRWHAAAEAPQPGDLVFFSYGRARPDHVGVVESYDANTGRITSIQGNTTDVSIGRTGNCVRRKVHTRAYVVGYGRPAYAAPAPGKPATSAGTYYTVARGDTLAKIATRTGSTVDAIMRLNRGVIRNPNVIQVNQRIRVR